MTAQLLEGRTVAAHIRSQVKQATLRRLDHGLRPPGLAVILIGDDPASHIYVKNKHKACEEVGFFTPNHHLPHDYPEEKLLTLIEKLNADPTIDGILVQLPLPNHIDTNRILEHIRPDKDVDGFHPYNLGRLAQRRPLLRPCTPYGIIQLLEYYKLDPKGLSATVVGASNIVGRPTSLELLIAGATVTTCHRFTKDLAPYVQQAELLVVAVGKHDIVQPEWIKPGSIVIDVGMHRLEDGSLCGDLDFASASERAAWITPVPGGVGPMTIAALLQNTLFSAEQLHD